MLTPQVSFIAPIYNTQLDYIDRAVESVLKQEGTFELILIDDGSEEKVALHLDAWARRDSRILVFHKENGGVSSARNRGIKEARGEYVAFLDADDEIKENFLSRMLKVACATSCDIVLGAHENRLSNGLKRLVCAQESIGESSWVILEGDKKDLLQVSTVDARALSELGLNPVRYMASWGHLFKTETIKNIQFDESLVICEDAIFNWMAIAASKCVAITNNDGYCHHLNSLSATRKLRPSALQEMTHVANRFKELQASEPDLPYIDSANQAIYTCFCYALSFGPMRKGFREACNCSKSAYIKELLDQRVFKEMFGNIKPWYFAQKVLCSLARKRHTRLLILCCTIWDYLLMRKP